MKGNGFAPQTLRAVREWAKQFDVPLLHLTPIDTIKQLVLNPAQLGTIQAAQALVARTDSTKQALDQGFKALDVGGTVDSARALAARLHDADPKKLGLDGTRQAIQSAKQTLDRLDQTRKQVEGLQRQVGAKRATARQWSEGSRRGEKEGLRVRPIAAQAAQLRRAPDREGLLRQGEHRSGAAGALLGGDRAEVHAAGTAPARRPRAQAAQGGGHHDPVPEGASVPAFLLQLGQVDFTIAGTGPLQGAYQALVKGVTTTPSLYGRPMTLEASRRAKGSAIAGIDVGAVIDHVTDKTKDSVAARLRRGRAARVRLPGCRSGWRLASAR